MGIIDSQCYNYCHSLSGFSSKFQLYHENVHHINVSMQNIPKVDELK